MMQQDQGASALPTGLSSLRDEAAGASSPEASIPSAAWLIEMIHNDAPVPRYWNHSKFKSGWVWDANEAMRFCREKDARDFLDGLQIPLQGKPVQHVFVGMKDPIAMARECFLNMIADAERWDEDVDGDCDGDGRPVMYINYDMRVGHSQLQELCEVLGITAKGYDETLKEAIDRAVAEPPASAMSAEGQDPQGLGAQPASAVPQGDAQ